MKQILPHTIIDDSAESINLIIGKKSYAIYIAVITFVMIAIVSIFFIHVEINIRAFGTIKPLGDHIITYAPNSGYVYFNDIAENADVKKGDTLFSIKSEKIGYDATRLNHRKSDLKSWISDLELLTRNDSDNIVQPHSALYQRELGLFKSELENLSLKERTDRTEYSRYKILHKKELISDSEFESVQAKYYASKSAVNIQIEKQRSIWTSKLQEYLEELRIIESQLYEISISFAESTVIAPKDGTVQRIENLIDGTYVNNGQSILELSPNGELIVECYLNPKDIGYISIGQKAKIQVSAYNYNDWGILTGNIFQISDDVWITPNQKSSYYKVYIHLDKDYLKLKNGRKGRIKKGMDISCNIIVTRRSVYSLLYDKVDDWLNPNLIK